MKRESLVSIIVPCYNYGHLLSETLDSVIAQTYPHWECIIVDDGSIDNTKQVAEYYVLKDNRIKYLYKKNGGLSSARNAGIADAKGQYIQLLDSDDLLAERKLEIQVELLDAVDNIDIIYSDVRYFVDNDLLKLSRSFDMKDIAWAEEINGCGDDVIAKMLKYNHFVVNAPLFKTSLIDRVGNFNESLGSLEDWYFWLLCALDKACFTYCPDSAALAYVRIHSISMSQNRSRMLNFNIKVRQLINDRLIRLGNTKMIKANSLGMVGVLEELAIISFKANKVKDGVKLFLNAAKLSGKYIFYIKSILYWFRKKERSL